MLGVSIPERALANPDLRRVLGSALLGYWDAERRDLLTLADGAVSSWADAVGGYAPGQAVADARPLYSATAFGGRPGLVFDGVDDLLTLDAMPFPSGHAPSEIWVVASQDAGAADTANRTGFNYGGIVSGTTRGPGRTVSSGGVRGRAAAGGVAVVEATVALTGRHVIRQRIGAASFGLSVDGSAFAEAGYTNATGADRVRIGGNTINTANPWNGTINAILVTAALSDAQAGDLLAWGMARAGRG